MVQQSVDAYRDTSPDRISNKVNEILKKYPGLRVSSITMSEAWSQNGGWVSALVVYERD